MEQAVEAPLLFPLHVQCTTGARKVDDPRRSHSELVEQGTMVRDLGGLDDRHLVAALAQACRETISESTLVGQDQPTPFDRTVTRRERLAPERRPEPAGNIGDMTLHNGPAHPLQARGRLDPVALALERIGRQRHP
jgi:hypothetical protein